VSVVKKAIAILTRAPVQGLLLFYSQFRAYGFDVFCIIDDNSYRVTQSHQVQCIRINDIECIASGFFNLAPPYRCAAWDKAVYHFCKLQYDYDYVWFIEDDVLIPSVDTLVSIDRKYDYADIISAPNIVNETGRADGWFWWKHVPDELPPPWCRAMVCAVRLSNTVLKAVTRFTDANAMRLARSNTVTTIMNMRVIWRLRKRFAKTFGYELHKQHLKYPFIEFIFHTLAMRDSKCIVGADELTAVVWRETWQTADMRIECFYHPVKDISDHEFYRQRIEERYRPPSSRG
jgi:hypothetical protein